MAIKYVMKDNTLARSIADRLIEDVSDNHRMTDQRRAMCEILAIAKTHNHHPTVEEITLHSLGEECSPTTAYRFLQLLEKDGLIEVLDFRDGRKRYEIADHRRHGHVVNHDTGEIKEFDISPELAEILASVNDSGLPIFEMHMTLHVSKEQKKTSPKARRFGNVQGEEISEVLDIADEAA